MCSGQYNRLLLYLLRTAKMENRSPKILIIRLSAIGDVVQGMPVACALRDAYPDAQLIWCVQAAGAQLLEGHRAIDELIIVDRRWMKSLSGWVDLRKRLRQYRFDISVDQQGLNKSALIGRLSGARKRLGPGRPWGREFSRLLNNQTTDTPRECHVVDRNLQILKPLGIESPELKFDVPHFARAAATIENHIRLASFERPPALINVGAGWPSKLWPAERYAEVAQYLGTRHQLPTWIVWAGEEERMIAQRVVSLSDGHAMLAPPTSLQELAELIRGSSLFIGSDTGPLHLAAAIGVPCIGLYGPWPAAIHGPYGEDHIAVEKMRFDGPSHLRRKAPSKYMEAIQVADICEACDRQIEKFATESY
jgi:lipopolysaccharide heptosyltransferase I